jgi:hypothetical protein
MPELARIFAVGKTHVWRILHGVHRAQRVSAWRKVVVVTGPGDLQG